MELYSSFSLSLASVYGSVYLFKSKGVLLKLSLLNSLISSTGTHTNWFLVVFAVSTFSSVTGSVPSYITKPVAISVSPVAPDATNPVGIVALYVRASTPTSFAHFFSSSVNAFPLLKYNYLKFILIFSRRF